MIVLLACITFAVYSPVLKAQFLNWDDPKHITANVNVQAFDMTHIKALFQETVNDVYIPLTTLSFAFERHVFGDSPVVVHLDNLILHMAVVALVFLFAQGLGLPLWTAALGTLIFAIHPMRVESVAWATERKDVLYAVFYMAALLSYQKQKGVLTFIFGALSMLAKPMALSLPLILLLMDWFKGDQITWRTVLAKWPYVLMVALIGWLTYQHHVRMPVQGLGKAALTGLWTFTFYIKQFFVPLVSLPIVLLPKPVALGNWAFLSSVLMSAALMAGLWRWRGNKIFVFAFAFYALSIFFLLRLDDQKDINIVADRFMYLPGLGFCFLTAWAIERVYVFLKTQEAVIRFLYSVAVVCLLAGLGFLTYQQTFVWQDTVSLWRHQIRVAPHAIAYNNLANTYLENETYKHDDALIIDTYQQAIRHDEKFLDAYYNLGRFYQDKLQLTDALAWYNKALAIDPKYKNALFSAAQAYEQLNQPKETINAFNQLLKAYPDDEDVYINIIEAYGRAVERNPKELVYQEKREEILTAFEQLSKRKAYNAVDYFNLGFLYEQVGGKEEATRYYVKAVTLQPNYAQALYNLANLYQGAGDFKTAMALYSRLVHFHPKFTLGFLNMGVIFNALGDQEKARQMYEKVISLDPENSIAYFNLGYLSENSGELKDALGHYEKAIDLDPKNAEAYYNLGNVYAKLGQNGEAIAAYLKTVEINPTHQDAFVNLSILSFKSRDFQSAIAYLQKAQDLGYTVPEEYLKTLEPYRKK